MTRKGSPMFLRMLVRAALLRKERAASALAATIVAAATATAMLNLVVDVQAKLHKEFRKFGANLIVQAPDGKSFTAEDIGKVNAIISGHGTAVPVAYAVARTERDQPIVVAGTDLEKMKKINPWWAVSAWPAGERQALVGTRAMKAMGPASAFDLQLGGRKMHFTLSGTLQTGAGEDSRVYLSLQDFQSWTGLQPSVIEVSANGSPVEVNSIAQSLRAALTQAEVNPVRQVTAGEANLLGKTRSTLIASATFIVITASLCVLATLMGWVFDRRRDFAIMKALGASDRLIAFFVTGEAAVMGGVGAVVGFIAGLGIAAWIGHVNFQASIAPRLSVFPPVLIGTLLIVLAATVLPLRLLAGIQPAMILKGE
jgi:putative ABC transport system permease protein